MAKVLSRLWHAVLMTCLWTAACFAQPIHFSCPPAGTVEQRGLGKLTYTGPSSADSFICEFSDYSNRSKSLLFNFYAPDATNKETIRSEMIDLLSRKKPTVSFEFTTRQSPWMFKHTWTYLRRERLRIGGRTFNTVVLEEETLQTNGAQLHGVFTRWLDPMNGLWLKSHFRYISGQVTGGVSGYQDVSITFP